MPVPRSTDAPPRPSTATSRSSALSSPLRRTGTLVYDRQQIVDRLKYLPLSPIRAVDNYTNFGMALTNAGPGSVLNVVGSAAVPIPIFGTKIEGVIAKQIGDLLASEEAYLKSRLG